MAILRRKSSSGAKPPKREPAKPAPPPPPPKAAKPKPPPGPTPLETAKTKCAAYWSFQSHDLVGAVKAIADLPDDQIALLALTLPAGATGGSGARIDTLRKTAEKLAERSA